MYIAKINLNAVIHSDTIVDFTDLVYLAFALIANLSTTWGVTNNSHQSEVKTVTNESTKIVIWGTNLSSTVGVKYTRSQLAMVCLPPYQYSIIIGLVLSDAWLIIKPRGKIAILGFQQSASHSEYLWFVYILLSHYCSSYPWLKLGSRLGKKTIGLEF